MCNNLFASTLHVDIVAAAKHAGFGTNMVKVLALCLTRSVQLPCLVDFLLPVLAPRAMIAAFCMCVRTLAAMARKRILAVFA